MKTESNVEICSDGVRHWVEVDGVAMSYVKGVNIDYEFGELVSATIKVFRPKVNNFADRDK